MKIKILAWIIGMVLSSSIAFAQTGLFNDVTATTFATTGIIIVVVILVIKEMFKRFFNKK